MSITLNIILLKYSECNLIPKNCYAYIYIARVKNSLKIFVELMCIFSLHRQVKLSLLLTFVIKTNKK